MTLTLLRRRSYEKKVLNRTEPVFFMVLGYYRVGQPDTEILLKCFLK